MTTAQRGLTPARQLGAGGEAEVFEVAERPGLAFKRFRNPSAARAAKLRVMLAHPPDGMEEGGHVAFAWPTELVAGAGDVVQGFLMPRIDLSRTVPVFQVYNPASRAEIAPGFTWRYLLRAARNVAAIVAALHRAGYVVGDINESNLLVNRRALAVLVDCDSMQVRDPVTGEVHRGGVGKPEYTAPELQGRDLSSVDRTCASDDFALAVLVFQLLLEGVHPFAGIWKGRGDPPEIPQRMRHGHFPYRRGTPVAPPPRALALDVLPPELRRLVRRAFGVGIRRPHLRPTAADWAAALERADERLRTCDRSPHHVFGAHRRRCPWCERFDAGLPDPFPGPERASPLTRRPPPRSVRVRAAAAALVASVAATVLAGARRAVTAAASRVWSALRGPLAWPVPVALAFAIAGALVPAAGFLLFCARVGGVPALQRAQIPWARIAAEVAAATAAAYGASFVLRDGPPPLDAVAATAAGLLAFCARFGGSAAPVRARTLLIGGLWGIVAAGMLALAMFGPWWVPSLGR